MDFSECKSHKSRLSRMSSYGRSGKTSTFLCLNNMMDHGCSTNLGPMKMPPKLISRCSKRTCLPSQAQSDARSVQQVDQAATLLGACYCKLLQLKPWSHHLMYLSQLDVGPPKIGGSKLEEFELGISPSW